MVMLDGNCAVGCGSGTDYPQNTYISTYIRTNRCYNERCSRINYVRSIIPHCTHNFRRIAYDVVTVSTELSR